MSQVFPGISDIEEGIIFFLIFSCYTNQEKKKKYIYIYIYIYIYTHTYTYLRANMVEIVVVKRYQNVGIVSMDASY